MKKINVEFVEIVCEVVILMVVGFQFVVLKNSLLIDIYKIVREINLNGMILVNISLEVVF